MNADRLINMIMRRFMRVAVNKGVDMSISGAAGMAKKMRRPQQTDEGQDVYIDDHGNTIKRRNRKS